MPGRYLIYKSNAHGANPDSEGVMKTNKTEHELLSDISEKIDRAIGLLAIRDKNEDEKVRILYGLGLDAPPIGALLGLSPDAVRQRKSRARKR